MSTIPSLRDPEHFANLNVVKDNWRWPEDLDRIGWAKGDRQWKRFSDAWWGQAQQKIGDFLPFQTGDFPHLFEGAPSSILIRKCYVDKFDFIWNYGLIHRKRGIIILVRIIFSHPRFHN